MSNEAYGEAWLIAAFPAQMLPNSLGGDARREIDQQLLVQWDAGEVCVIYPRQ